jgi:hypothetical protein
MSRCISLQINPAGWGLLIDDLNHAKGKELPLGSEESQ